MKKIIALSCITILLSLTSCINIIEEIFLNRDGSGKYLLTLDMSSMIAMKEMLVSQTKLSKKDSLKLAQQKYDSTIYFTNMPDSITARFHHPELIQRSTVNLKIDESTGEMNITLNFPFKKIAEVNDLLADINNIKGDTKLKKYDVSIFGYLPTYSATKKSIERVTTLSAPKENDSLAFLGTALFASARVKTIYHLPGKVKSTTITDAYIRDRECVVELTYPEFTTKKKSMDGKVFFK